MANAFYSALVILIALSSVAFGFRKGITRQIAALLGFAFGVAAARVLAPEFTQSFVWTNNFSLAPEFRSLTANLFCAAILYAGTFALFSLLSPLLQRALAIFYVGIFNRILGAFFALLKNLLWLSILLNLLLCCAPASGLLRFQKSNDGNLVGAVMALTPALLGCFGADDFQHYYQLREAKFISCNFTTQSSVIGIEPLREND